jgi:hypothetical protein
MPYLVMQQKLKRLSERWMQAYHSGPRTACIGKERASAARVTCLSFAELDGVSRDALSTCND